jgi:hypothetical protein
MKTLTMLLTAGLMLVIIGITLSLGAKITQDIGDDMPAGSHAQNASIYSTTAIADLGSWQPTIAVVIAAVVIIGLLLSGFGAFLYMSE